MDTSIPQNTRKRQLSTEPIFYTYILYRNDVIFYVGKGKGRRIENHFDCAHKQENCNHQVCRVIRKEEREGGMISKVKIAEGIPEQAAFDLEKLFISLGTIYNWPLVNKTLGGEGMSGYSANVGRKHRPEVVEAHRQRMIKLYVDNPEECERKRQQSIERWETLEQRERIVHGMRRAFANPDMIEKWSEKSRQMWSTPEYRTKMQEIHSKPEVRARMGKGQLGKTPPNTKTYTGFLAPDGVTLYKDVYNLTAFCREHELSRSKMSLVALGKRQSHKGWTCYPPIEKPTRPITYYRSSFKSPTGEVFANIISLSAFCRENDLQPDNMRAVAQGKKPAHKGWTLYPPLEFDIRTYHGSGFLSPEKVAYTDIPNLDRFCKEHGLNRPAMSAVAHGKRKSHQGWTRYNPDDPS